MEIIDTKKEKSVITEELLKQEFAPKKKLKLLIIMINQDG